MLNVQISRSVLTDLLVEFGKMSALATTAVVIGVAICVAMVSLTIYYCYNTRVIVRERILF